MNIYKTRKEDDPFYAIYSDERWLYPYRSRADFPLFINVELTNRCNLDCLYCARQRIDNRAFGYMSIEHFERLVQEARHHKCALKFAGWGEPLMHRHACDFVRLARDNGVPVALFTNGSYLTEKVAKELVEAGLTDIRFSSSGLTKEEHETTRLRSSYQKTFEEKIRMVHGIREAGNTPSPYITISTNLLSLGANRDAEIESYRRRWLPFVDKICILNTFYERVKDHDRVQKYLPLVQPHGQYKACVEIMIKLFLHWDGTIVMCDNVWNREADYSLGRLGDTTLAQAWIGAQMMRRREMTSGILDADGEFKLCVECPQNVGRFDEYKGTAAGEGEFHLLTQ